ncbi:MAG: 50S ribosomal protein L21 [Christensenellales bacterium]|jgi:large subunit ribosomal protein L21|nr:50S ribosomal protein L21 [Clostridiales bacterium]
MYAIVEVGGKQYKVEKDQLIKVELIKAEIGETVDLKVVMISDNGKVFVANDVNKSKVKAEVVFNGKGPKLNIFTYKAKKNIRKRQGHRQPYTQLKIVEIKK